jgi:hypothetical protein
LDEQKPPEASRFSDLIATIKARPVLFGGVGALVLIAIVAIVVIALGGGGEGTAAGTTTTTTSAAGVTPTATIPDSGATASNTSVPGEGGEQTATVDRNPLTGDPLDVASNIRVVAVKVDNAPEAGPAIGIQDAEMIVEGPVEGGLTRLTAMFFAAQPTAIGPVRSVRPVDADLLAPWRPFLVTTGGQSFVYRELEAAGIDILDPDNAAESGVSGLFQQTERRPPYHLVATIPLIQREAGAGAPPVAVLPFGDDPLDGDPATTVQIPFSGVADVAWHYDAAADTYSRTVDGQPFQVYPEYNAELAEFDTDTVIVIEAAQRSAGYTDSAGADVPTFDVIGFGKVEVFSGGEVRTGQWLRSAQSDGWVFIDDTGASFTIPPGRVWLEIVPRFVDVTFE